MREDFLYAAMIMLFVLISIQVGLNINDRLMGIEPNKIIINCEEKGPEESYSWRVP